MKYSYNLSILENEDDVSYYLLGAFIADGNIGVYGLGKVLKTRISSKDLDWLEKIRDCFCQSLPIKNKGNFYELQIYSNEISKWFVNHNCTIAKSLTVRMPNIPDKFLPDFIRGCIDGDGSIGTYPYTKTKGGKIYEYTFEKVYLCSGSELFLKDISTKLSSLEIKHSFDEVKQKPSVLKDRVITPKNKHYRLYASGKQAASFLNWVYYPNHKLSMPRKAKLAESIISMY